MSSNPQIVFALAIAVAVLLPILLAVLIFLGMSRYSQIKNGTERYSLLSHFPFELFARSPSGSPVYLYVLFSLYLVISIGGGFLLLDYQTYSFPYALFLFGVHVIEMLILLFLIRTPAAYHRRHMLLATSYFCLVAIYAFLAGAYLWTAGELIESAASIISFLLFGLAVLQILLMLAPQFGKWAKMKTSADENGDVVVARPKFFILAAAEWGSILLDCLCSILLLVGVALLAVSYNQEFVS